MYAKSFTRFGYAWPSSGGTPPWHPARGRRVREYTVRERHQGQHELELVRVVGVQLDDGLLDGELL